MQFVKEKENHQNHQYHGRGYKKVWHQVLLLCFMQFIMQNNITDIFVTGFLSGLFFEEHLAKKKVF